ncbi:Nn.00g031150.m01.CDS01 [Neocucurbitaria sp. VM-36]
MVSCFFPETESEIEEEREAQAQVEAEAASAIRELQHAFTSLLFVRNATFAFFSLPRELRDTIYYHYIYRPRGVVYKCQHARASPSNPPEDIISLFLVSRQVYDEALQVFCRYNTIKIWIQSDYRKSVHGKLRLFPDRPGQMLQLVCMEYFEFTSRIARTSRMAREYGFYSGESPAKVFIQMIQDAHTFKSFFPKLRGFTAEWFVSSQFFEKHGLYLENEHEEENVQIWLEWMRKHVNEENVVPPRWLKIKSGNKRRNKPIIAHEESMNAAYKILIRETAALRDTEKELEESGRRWLEESWGEGRKKRRKRRQLQGCV